MFGGCPTGAELTLTPDLVLRLRLMIPQGGLPGGKCENGLREQGGGTDLGFSWGWGGCRAWARVHVA